jgi:hypothetical protein
MIVDLAGNLLQLPPGLHRLIGIEPRLAQRRPIDEQHRQREGQRQGLQSAAGVIDRIGDLRVELRRVELLSAFTHDLVQGPKARPGAEEFHAVIRIEQASCGKACLFSRPRASCNTTLPLPFCSSLKRKTCVARMSSALPSSSCLSVIVLRLRLPRQATAKQNRKYRLHVPVRHSSKHGQFIREPSRTTPIASPANVGYAEHPVHAGRLGAPVHARK